MLLAPGLTEGRSQGERTGEADSREIVDMGKPMRPISIHDLLFLSGETFQCQKRMQQSMRPLISQIGVLKVLITYN